jgi:DNA (cytosine-5)-methyltransferase 1
MNLHDGAEARDITQEDPGAAPDADVILGGPPCQAFARVGRAKLREIADHARAYQRDPRANLYLSYLEYVRNVQPLALLVENVPDVLNYGGHNIAEEMCEVLSGLGYRCRYTILNAAHYGVPQMRERMFLIALARELKAEVEFPQPTHWMDLPRGYRSSRQVALQAMTDSEYFTPASEPSQDLQPAVTAREALGDLPPITAHLDGKMKRGARRFDTLAEYRRNGAMRGYARLMRTWPGFESRDGVRDHVIRSLPRDYRIFAAMQPGDEYPQAVNVALRLYEEERRRRPGARLREFVPPYSPEKFPNKWRKMEADLPARTLMAHLGKDSYSHIHYDSAQARTISVREAARLQSFPDGFVFAGTMNPAFRQIGNAVPPLLAKALAGAIAKALGMRAT